MTFRILHVLDYVEIWGNGVINAAVDIACVQARQGQTVGVVSSGGGYEPLLAHNGVQHFTIPRPNKAANLAKACQAFHRICTQFRPDVVHCHHVAGMLVAKLLRPLHGYALVSHVHNVEKRSSRVMELGDCAIAVSDAVRKAMLGRRALTRRVSVVRNQFVGSLRRKDLPGMPSLTLQQPAIVCVAGLNKRKNIDGLIRAFEIVGAQAPDAHLYLVGHGPDRDEFQEQARNTAVAGRIHFEGFQEDCQAYMRQAHVFVLASHRESFGMVLQEAREAGAAIVATEVDGIPEALDYGRAGMLIAPGNDNALAAALLKLLTNPDEHAHWKNASQSALSEQTVWRMGEQVLNVYRDLVPSR